MKALNLPGANLRIRTQGDKTQVFDSIRKRFIHLTSEEWVRQHFIHYLINFKSVPASLIGIEKKILYNRLVKRCDIVVYDRNGLPLLIVECKAPEVEITQEVFNQIAMYNMTLKVNYLVVTNGMEHIACFIDFNKQDYSFLKEIPEYSVLAGEVL